MLKVTRVLTSNLSKKIVKSKRSQVWIETVIYTLIGLSIIGILLAVALPKINEIKDRTVLDQSVDMLNIIDSKINEAKYVAGNSRVIDLNIKKGKLIVDGVNDYIEFILEDSKSVYSEPGEVISIGNIKTLTEKNGKISNVKLKLDYKDSLNITYEGKDELKTFQSAPTPYNVVISNMGYTNGLVNIDFS